MGLICSQATFMYSGILKYEKKYKCKDQPKLEKIKRWIEGMTSLNKYAVHSLVRYKAYYDPDFDWNQFRFYDGAVNYANQLREEADVILRKKIKFEGFNTAIKPKILHRRGYRLLNGYANIYVLCCELTDAMGEEEKEFFNNAVVRHVLRAYGMAERIEEKTRKYEERPGSQEAIELLTKEVGKFNYDPIRDAVGFKQDHERYEYERENKKKMTHIYPDYKVIFMSHEKCAETNLFFAFGVNWTKQKHKGILGFNDDTAEPRNKMSYYIKNYPDYLPVTFVRNPWNRVVSNYFFQIQNAKGRKKIDFEEFVFNNPYKKLKPFTEFINVSKERLFIGRVERIKTDFNRLAKKLDIKIDPKNHPLDGKHKNKSSRPTKGYKNFYTPETRDFVAKQYAADIEYFGYKF
jgi:hypothetical protein